jgi:hypothetical protein
MPGSSIGKQLSTRRLRLRDIQSALEQKSRCSPPARKK